MSPNNLREHKLKSTSPIPSSSGVEARRWRKQLAATARRSDDTIRTLKFPLEIERPEQYWPAAQALHATVASDAEGSLIHYLYVLLLNGFRVFGKQAETESFRNQAVLDDAGWLQSMSGHWSLTVAAATFVPSEIYKRLLFAPRAVGGKDSGFKAATITVEYAKFFCAGKHSENIPEPEAALFNAIGEAMEVRFGSWKELTSQPVEGAKVIDAVLAELGYTTNSLLLYQRLAALRPSEPAGTVAFDDAAPVFADTAGIAPHMIVSRALAAGRCKGLSAKPELTKFAQAFFTGDANHGGAAWVFGKGLIYFQDTEIDDAMSDFGIPDDKRSAIEAVRFAAKAIPDASGSLFGGKNYASYRSSIGGTLGSWIANYITRLFELEAVLAEDIAPFVLPDALLADERMLAEANVSSEEIANMVSEIGVRRPLAKQAIARLNGTEPGASRADIDAMESYNTLLSTLSGLLSAINEKIKKQIEIANRENDKFAQQAMEECLIAVPKWICRLDAINRLDLSVVAPEKELSEAVTEFELLHNTMHDHYADLLAWGQTTGQTLCPITRLAAREDQHIRNKDTAKKRPVAEQAARTSFNMLGKAGRECSEATMRRVADLFRPIFADSADCNRYFHNRLGTLYKSNFDKNPRQPFAIPLSAVQNAESFMRDVAAFIADFREEVMAESPLSLTRVTDLYQLERALFAWRMTGLPDMVPTHLALPESLRDVFNLPMPIRMRLLSQNVSSHILRQIFNQYYVRLKALAAILLRDTFYLRCKFQQAGNNALIYAPGADDWHAPERLFSTTKPIGEAARAVFEALHKRIISPLSATRMLAGSDVPETSVRAFLRQSPHDWYFPWSGQPAVEGLMVNKEGLAKRLAKQSAARLVGATAYKGILDTRLSDPASVEIGDVAIIFDQTFRQACVRGEDGKLVLTCEPQEAIVNLALPVTEYKEEPKPPTFTRYVAIDLGERGIGYAVFNAENDTLIETGKVPVRSMHRLVQDDRIGKRATSRINKFRAKFDRAEERRRENIVGDFCNAINRLMWYYDAFPVLEYSAGGASSSVDKVYDAVISRYLFNTTPSVDAQRQSYWCGASFWKHPQRLQYKYDATTGKKGKTPEPLSLFPGSGVSGYETSQRCSCCGRNPLSEIRDVAKANDNKFEIEEGGFVTLPSGTIRLYFSAPESERAEYRRRNERTPLSKPADAMQIKADDLIRLVRRNLRQAPASRQAKDTSISQYHCLYDDCGKVIHAEINAGINIGKKFAELAPKSASTISPSSV